MKPECIFYSQLYKTIILPVTLYGHKTWSLTLEEEHGLRVFENREQDAEENTWTEERLSDRRLEKNAQ
jgi:hypothetical protein